MTDPASAVLSGSLVAVASGFGLGALRPPLGAPLAWSLALVGGVALFGIAPQPFLPTLVWAVVAAMVWLSALGTDRSAHVAAGIAGAVIGAVGPTLNALAAPILSGPLAWASLATLAFAIAAGAAAARIPGAALSLLSATMMSGQFAIPILAALISLTALAVVALAPRAPRLAHLALFLAPVIGLLGD